MNCPYKFHRWLLTVLAVILFLSLEIPAGFADPLDESGEALFEQAQQMRNEGRLGDAEAAMLQAIRLEPSNGDYYFELSNVYAALYDQWQSRPNAPQAIEILNRSQRALEQTLLYRPDYLAAQFNLGIVYKRQGQYEKARDAFRKVLRLSPNLAAAWFQIGAIYQEQGFWDDAEDAYLKARELSYDPYEINEVLQELRQARANGEQTSARSPSFGGMGNNGFGSQSRMDAFGGGSQNLYGNVANNANQQGQSTSALPSLAAMMIQSMLSRNSQSSDASRQ